MAIVAVYRHQLFKRSETFIHAQASTVPRHKMLYVGRSLFAQAPSNAEYIVLNHAKRRLSCHALRHVITRYPGAYVRLLNDHNVGIVHAHFGVDAIYAQAIAESLRLPLITTFHGFDASMSTRALLSSRKPALINYCVYRNRLARTGARFLCVSEFVRQAVLNLGFPFDRTIVHYIGIDTQKILYSSLRSDLPTVLHVARLVEKKGTKYLIKAFAQVVKKIPEARLQIVGEGPLEPLLRAMVVDEGIEHSVRFLGSLPNQEVLKLMAHAWILCVPSVTAASGDSEGLPIVVLEAAASGMPVVATRHGGLSEGVKDQVTGILHNERDSKQLAADLIDLLSNAHNRRKMGLNARNHVVEHFNLQTQSKLLADIYDSVL